MEEEWRDDILRIDSPRFASYAALLRGVLHERGYAEWCRWVADRLEGTSAGLAVRGTRRARHLLCLYRRAE